MEMHMEIALGIAAVQFIGIELRCDFVLSNDYSSHSTLFHLTDGL